MLNNFRRRPLTVYINVMLFFFFACLIFVAKTDYENILTTKIFRFTVYIARQYKLMVASYYYSEINNMNVMRNCEI